MKTITARIRRGGGKTLSYLFAAVFALCAAQSARAHSTWICPSGSGASWGAAANWSGTGGSLLFTNATTSVKDLSYLNADYVGKFKIGNDTTARYRGLYYGGRNANAPWKLNGQGKYKYDCSGAGAENTGKFVVGYRADACLCAYAISLKAYNVQIGHDSAGTYSGTLRIYNTSDGSPTLESSNDMWFYKGALYATNTALTCGRNMDVYDFHVNKKGGDWSVTGRLYIGVPNSTFCHDGGSMTVGGQFRVSNQTGSSGEFTMNGGNVTADDNLYVGCNSNVVKGVFNMNGGNFTCNGTTYVPFAKNVNPAELHINGGTFTAAGTFVAGGGTDPGSTGIIDLNGSGTAHGVLETKGLTLGSGTATLTFNGGELKAIGTLESSGLIKSGITVRVGENGGIVNANEKSVSIPVALGAVGDTGAMTFKGGGTVALSGVANYTGVTMVEWGTTLATTSANKDNMVDRGFYVVLPASAPETATFTVLTVTDGTPTASDLEKCYYVGVGYCTFEISGNSIIATYDSTGTDYVWADADSGASWTAANKWTDKGGHNVPWNDGNPAVFAAAGDVAAIDSAVSAESVTFRANATVNGTAALTVPQVVVSNGVSAAINASTAGELVKEGPGALTLAQNRTDQTTLSEGALAMSSATVDGTKLTLGTATNKPVVFDYGGQTLAANPGAWVGASSDATLTNGTFGVAGGAFELPQGTLRFAADAAHAGATTLTVGTTGTAALYNKSDWTTTAETTIGSGANSDGRFYHEKGTLAFGKHVNVSNGSGANGLLEIRGGLVKSDQNYISVGKAGTGVMTVKAGGEYDNSTAVAGGGGNMVVAYTANSSGTLNIEGGLATVKGIMYLCYDANSDHATVNVTDGGVLTIGTIQQRSTSQNDSVLTIDGGTLRAYGDNANFVKAGDKFLVKVGSNGAIIDNNGKTVTIQEALMDAASGAGAVTNVGTGKITYSVSQTGTGAMVCAGGETFLGAGLTMSRPVTVKDGAVFTAKATAQSTLAGLTLEAGSTLNIDTPTANVTPMSVTSLVLPETGVVTLKVNGGNIPVGKYAILSKTGLGLEDVANLAPSVPSGGVAEFSISADTLYLDVSSPYIWTGAAGDGNFFTTGNWLDFGDNVPASLASDGTFVFATNGEVTVHYNAADSGQSAFCLSQIVFGEEMTGVVTIDGDAIASIAKVVNNNATYDVDFQNEVQFSGNVDVVQSTGAVKFTGGATGVKVINNTEFYGKYTLTYDNNDYVTGTLKSGSELHLPNATYFCHVNTLTIEPNAKVIAKNGLISRGKDAYYTARNDGVFYVTNRFTVTGTEEKMAYLVATSGGGENSAGTFVFNEILLNGKNRLCANNYKAPVNVVIGKGGLTRDSSAATTGYFQIGNGTFQTIGTLGDSFISYANKDIAGSKKVIYHVDDSNAGVAFDTTDYEDRTIGRTIADYGQIGASSPAKFSVAVYGKGTFVFANTVISDGELFAGGLTVSNSATVVVNAGSCPGKGAVELKDTATFIVPQSASGTATVFGNLSMVAGTTLSVSNLTANAVSAPLTLNGALTLPASGTVNLVACGADGANLAAGVYKLATFASAANAAAVDVSKFDLSGAKVATGLAAGLSVSGNTINLDVGFVVTQGGTTLRIPYAWANQHGVTTSEGLLGKGANGMTYFESYAMGLDPANANSVPVTSAEASGSNLVFSLGNVSAPEGVTLTVKVRRRAPGGSFADVDGTTRTIVGPATGSSQAIPVPLDGPGDVHIYALDVTVSATAVP